jgi:hypothetical protein
MCHLFVRKNINLFSNIKESVQKSTHGKKGTDKIASLKLVQWKRAD